MMCQGLFACERDMQVCMATPVGLKVFPSIDQLLAVCSSGWDESTLLDSSNKIHSIWLELEGDYFSRTRQAMQPGSQAASPTVSLCLEPNSLSAEQLCLCPLCLILLPASGSLFVSACGQSGLPPDLCISPLLGQAEAALCPSVPGIDPMFRD